LLNKVREDYDAIAGSFSDTRTDLWPEMESFRDYVKRGGSVLDIGCGNGRAYQLFRGLAIEYEGIDVSERLIERAKAQVADLLASFRVGSVLDLPYEDTTFDTVLAVAVLHHIPSRRYRRRALGEVFRVLKPGGHLLMTNWNTFNYGFLIRHPRNALEMLLPRRGLDFRDILVPWKKGRKKADRYLHAFTRRELGRLCRQAGFEVLEQYYVKEGLPTSWLKGHNLVTVCRRPLEPAESESEDHPFLQAGGVLQ